jgi:hypothetical protein
VVAKLNLLRAKVLVDMRRACVCLCVSLFVGNPVPGNECWAHINSATTFKSLTLALCFTCRCTGLLCRMVEVMVAVLSDPRVKAPDASGAALGTLRSMLSIPDHVRAVERAPVCRPLVAALLAAYDGKLWVHSTDVLVRFWSGCGFAFTPCVNVMDSEDPADLLCASAQARNQFADVCAESPTEANKFLNSLINNVRRTTRQTHARRCGHLKPKTHKHARTDTRARARAHTHTHTRTHTHTHTHTRTHTHTHACKHKHLLAHLATHTLIPLTHTSVHFTHSPRG